MDTQSITAGIHTAVMPELQGPFRGPLFKELFGEFPDIEATEQPVRLESSVRSGLYAHTTDVQSLEQFLGLRSCPPGRVLPTITNNISNICQTKFGNLAAKIDLRSQMP